jgi:hypothetical protein
MYKLLGVYIGLGTVVATTFASATNVVVAALAAAFSPSTTEVVKALEI